MLEKNGVYLTFTCDYCGKVFLKFNLSALYHYGYRETFQNHIFAARNAGHIIGYSVYEDNPDETLDFCREKCENKYHNRFFPDTPPDILFHKPRFVRDLFNDQFFDAEYDIEELGDDTNELDDLNGIIDFQIDEDVYNF